MIHISSKTAGSAYPCAFAPEEKQVISVSSKALRTPVRLARLSNDEAAPAHMSRRLIHLARSLEALSENDDMVQFIVAAAVANVPGAEHAAIARVSKHGSVTTAVATSNAMAEIHRLHDVCTQGPVLSAVDGKRTVRVDDLSTESRWPWFAVLASTTGIRSLLVLQLFVRETVFGTLTIGAAPAHAFDSEGEDIAIMLAAHSALALAGGEREGNLRIALASRDVIGQAKGILMERHQIGEAAAFQLMIRASQESNRKLTAIAAMVTSSGLDLTPSAAPAPTGGPRAGGPRLRRQRGVLRTTGD